MNTTYFQRCEMEIIKPRIEIYLKSGTHHKTIIPKKLSHSPSQIQQTIQQIGSFVIIVHRTFIRMHSWVTGMYQQHQTDAEQRIKK